MTRLEQLYAEAGELLRGGDPRRAADRIGAALIELEGIRAARIRPQAPLRRAVAAEDARAEALGSVAERLRVLAHEVRVEMDRLEQERRLTRGQRRLRQTFEPKDGEGLRAVDRNA